MEDKEKLRKIIKDTRLQKNIARDKISELLKLKGIKYAESSLSRYENGITESIKAEVLKGISEITAKIKIRFKYLLLFSVL